MTNILSLDLSTQSSGWAVKTADGAIYSGVIKSSSKRVEKRIDIITTEIIELIKKYNIDTIIAEEVRNDGYNTRTGKVLMWMQGYVVVNVFKYNKDITIDFLNASSWRSKIGIQGYRVQRTEQKQIDIAYANRVYGKQLKSDEDDEADALCLLDAFTKPEQKLF